MMNDTKNIRVSREQWKIIKQLACDQETSIFYVLRDIINKYLVTDKLT